MNLADVKWLWTMSTLIWDDGASRKRIFDRARILKQKVHYLVKGVLLISSLQTFRYPPAGSAMQRALQQRPELAGVVIWPYMCTSWNAGTRVRRIYEHFRVIDTMNGLDFPFNQQLTLLDLSEVAADVQVVLDQPKWFMREGMLVLNLFTREVRIYSLAFSFGFEAGGIAAYVGAIQGVDIDGIMDDYRDLTKAMHGMRPRDLLVELFRTFCRSIGVRAIYAVKDNKRQHRSGYFGPAKSGGLFLNYDEIWEERGGVRQSDDFFLLSTEAPVKNLDGVPSKKRAMYRRRYDLLRSLSEKMHERLHIGLAVPLLPGVS